MVYKMELISSVGEFWILLFLDVSKLMGCGINRLVGIYCCCEFCSDRIIVFFFGEGYGLIGERVRWRLIC